MEVGLGNQRVTSKFLRSALPDICAFVEKFLVRRQQEEEQEKEKEGRIVIACESGKDISIGAALAIRCFLFDDEGDFRMPTSRDPKEKSLNKAAIRMKLSRVMLAYPEANPHRSTLQSVNSFLMG
jgi:tRNA A64-2'-O-ribosylphosphate transferase